MDLAAFEDGLDRYGADLAGWPPAIREAAMTLLESSAAAVAARAKLQAIEDILRAERTMPGAVGPIAAKAMRHPQERPLWHAVRQAAWAGATAAVLVLGLLVGDVGLKHQNSSDRVLATALDTLGTSDVD